MTETELLESRLEIALAEIKHCEEAAQLFPFRAGDHVKHAPTGETWVLACDQNGEYVNPAGWPESVAIARHCRIVKAATDQERLEMLREAANSSGQRASLARHQLDAESPKGPDHD